jgi:hypothetical protein
MSNAERDMHLRGVTAAAVALLKALDGGSISSTDLESIRLTVGVVRDRIGLDYRHARQLYRDRSEALYTDIAAKEASL